MNYRHAFHAGNFADVFKHVLLVRLLLALQRKSTPIRYLDTHAGIGWYDLEGDEARRGAEWQDGIGRLRAPQDPAVAALLQPYLDVIGPRDTAGRPSLYPGSPAVAQAILREQDKLICCELHPADTLTLRTAMKGDRRAKVVTLDGYTALNAFLPPPERRGLVLVDPPFEQRGEFTAMVEGLLAAHRKWATGVYALWYPIKDREALTDFAKALTASGMRRIAQIEILVDPGALARGALAGCGLVVVNPPFGIAEEAQLLMPHLAACLGRGEPATWRWHWLVGE